MVTMVADLLLRASIDVVLGDVLTACILLVDEFVFVHAGFECCRNDGLRNSAFEEKHGYRHVSHYLNVMV
jgi:hypothetical protein